MTLPDGAKWLFEKYAKKLTASMSYYEKRQRRARFVFKNDPAHQRVCRCEECGMKIPRFIPRVFHDAPYWKYHLCPKDALARIKEALREKKELVKELQENIQELETMKKEIEKLLADEVFKEKFGVLYLASKLEKKRYY